MDVMGQNQAKNLANIDSQTRDQSCFWYRTEHIESVCCCRSSDRTMTRATANRTNRKPEEMAASSWFLKRSQVQRWSVITEQTSRKRHLDHPDLDD